MLQETPTQYLPLTSLIPSRNNPRKESCGIEELASSVKAHGVLQPILARPFRYVPPAGLEEITTFEIVCGHRRWEAAKLAGLEVVPVIVRDLTDAEAREIAIIENLQREGITVMEEARALADLRSVSALTVEEIAARIGKVPRYVYQRLDLFNLDAKFVAMLERGEINFSHARAIAPLEAAMQKKCLKEAFANYGKSDDGVTYLSVRALEDWIAREVREKQTADRIAGMIAKAENDGRPLRQLSSATYVSGDEKLPAHITPRAKWKEAQEGCSEVADGLIVHGFMDRGKRIKVCTDPKCQNHSLSERDLFGELTPEQVTAREAKEKREAKERRETHKRDLAGFSILMERVGYDEQGEPGYRREDLALMAEHVKPFITTSEAKRHIVLERVLQVPANAKGKLPLDTFGFEFSKLTDFELMRVIYSAALMEEIASNWTIRPKLAEAFRVHAVTPADVDAQLGSPRRKPRQPGGETARKASRGGKANGQASRPPDPPRKLNTRAKSTKAAARRAVREHVREKMAGAVRGA